MNAVPYVLCPIVTRSEWAEKLDLPTLEHNIFFRIIKYPHPESDCPKELACTEMLAGVLMNSRVLRHALLRWMGTKLGVSTTPWEKEGASFRIGTEMPVHSKRDDLRIEIETEGVIDLLWSVEVKVGAGIHYSASLGNEQETGGFPSQAETEEEQPQLLFYDKLLLTPTAQKYPSASVAGFVLAKKSLRDKLPPGLPPDRWRCITWTDLGGKLLGFWVRKICRKRMLF